MSLLSDIRANLAPALTVALISFPLSISIAIVSGVDPVVGLIAGAWAGLLGAFFLGTQRVIVGVAASVISIQLGFLLKYQDSFQDGSGLAYVGLMTILAGVFLLLIRYFNLQSYIKYVPKSIVVGFAAGIGLVIIQKQLSSFLGVEITQNIDFSAVSLPMLALGLGSLLLLYILERFVPKVPGPVVLSILGIGLGYLIKEQGVEGITLLSDTYGTIQGNLISIPNFTALSFSNAMLIDIVVASMFVAIVVVLESLITGQYVSSISDVKNNPKRDIFGLGIINIIMGLIGGMPVLSLISRTSAGFQTGASKNVYLVLYGVIMGLLLIVLAPLVSFYPFPVIAAILVKVALPLIDIKTITALWRHRRSESVVAISVMILIVVSNASMAVLVGAVLSLLFIVHDQSKGHYYLRINNKGAIVQEVIDSKELPELEEGDLAVYGMEGSILYYNIDEHIQRLEALTHFNHVLVRLNHVYQADQESIDKLLAFCRAESHKDFEVVLTGIHNNVQELFDSNEAFTDLHKEKKVYASLSEAFAGLDYLRR